MDEKTERTIKIAEPSAKSLLIKMRFNGVVLSTATGFVVETAKGPALITNRHNVTGRNNNTGEILSKTCGTPNEIEILHNKKGKLGEWIHIVEKIKDNDDNPLWYEHPILGNKADFVALLLTNTADVEIYPYNLKAELDIRIGPTDSVSVVGFPFGIQAGGSLAVWATGFMASEPDIDYEDLPKFLIDCRSRQGQSGSAVIAYRSGGAIAKKDGGTIFSSNPLTAFLGIYSGRINEESDIGIVWKAVAIKELIEHINSLS